MIPHIRLVFLISILSLALGLVDALTAGRGNEVVQRDGTVTANSITSTILLQGGLQSSILLPGSDEYEDELLEFWSVGNQQIRPLVILRPKTTTEAATAITILSKFSIPFGIRSGGHSPNIGANSSPYVLIATTLLNAEIKYPSAGIASIGPGLRWEQVYEELLEHGNYTAAGGRYAKVGVGGFLLGGGLSHLSNEYGYGVDTVVSMEVVLGSGKVVTASEKTNSDLFWALKSGGNSFGLVTRFNIKLVQQKGGIWGGMLSIDSEHLDTVLQAVTDWQKEDQPSDTKAAVLLSFIKGPAVSSPNATLASLTLYYGLPVAYPAVFQRFYDIPYLSSSLGFTTHLSLAQQLASGDSHKKWHTFQTGTYKTSYEINRATLDAFDDAYTTSGLYEKDENSYTAYTIQAISKSLLEAHEGSHPQDLSPEGAPYVWYSMHVEWSIGALHDEILALTDATSSRLQQISAEYDASNNFIYVNDAAPSQLPYRSYGEDVVKRMKKIRQSYDPKGIFTKLCTGGFKLSIAI